MRRVLDRLANVYNCLKEEPYGFIDHDRLNDYYSVLDIFLDLFATVHAIQQE